MALTSSSGIYFCDYDQAKLVAECLGLRYEVCCDWANRVPNPDPEYAGMYLHFPQYYGTGFDMWQDRQLGGGMCRIVYSDSVGVAWVSRHSGYGPQADLTGEAEDLFLELGCVFADGSYAYKNPQIYPQ